jgi:predicted Co/Zn/Cd cation transporter (cation efflux family)
LASNTLNTLCILHRALHQEVTLKDVDSHVIDEQRVLDLSFYAAGVFVLMALGFALLKGSNLILFNGIYSFISFFMTLLNLKVASLVARPDDERFHFGYVAMEPTLNLFKSFDFYHDLLICCFGAANCLLDGDHSAEYGLAIV